MWDVAVDDGTRRARRRLTLLLGWRRCVVFDRRLLLSRRRRRRLSARPRSQSSAPRRSAWPATARCQSACRKSSRTAPPRASFHSESLGPPEPRPSNILPSTTPKVSEKQVCPHAPVVGPSNGTCGGYATRRNQENHHWLGHPRWATLRLATQVSPPRIHYSPSAASVPRHSFGVKRCRCSLLRRRLPLRRPRDAQSCLLGGREAAQAHSLATTRHPCVVGLRPAGLVVHAEVARRGIGHAQHQPLRLRLLLLARRWYWWLSLPLSLALGHRRLLLGAKQPCSESRVAALTRQSLSLSGTNRLLP